MELKDVLQSKQVTSILLNNCAVMRGKKTGLETQARKENPDLLDISGDTVHMMTNATEALRSPCSSEVEAALMYIITEGGFSEFQSLLHLPPKSLIRPINNKVCHTLYWWCTTTMCWIQVKNVNTGDTNHVMYKSIYVKYF